MLDFLVDICYHTTDGYCHCIEFHQDKSHRRGFNTSHLIDYSVEPNPDAGDDKNGPPQKMSISFSTADVVLLGWRLDRLGDYLRDNKLSAVGIFPARYADLERVTILVCSITITPVGKG